MIRRNGNSWEVRVYVGRDAVTGKERSISRSFPASPREKHPPRRVKDAEARLKTEVRFGKHPLTNPTVGEVLDLWLAHTTKTWSPWTVKGYRGIIDRYLKPQIGSMRVEKLTAARIEALYDSLSTSGGQDGQGLAPLTIRHVHAVLRRALNRAERHGHIVRNPADLVRPPGGGVRSRARATTPDEVGVLIAAADDPLTRLFVRLAAATGARRGEICGLRWSDLDLDAHTLTIQRSIADPDGQIIVKGTKRDRERTLTVGPSVTAALAARHDDAVRIAAKFGTILHPDAYIFSEVPDCSEPIHPDTMSKRFSRLAKKAGVTCRLHDLRHGHVTTLLGQGIDPVSVAKRVGHASTRMTLDVYGHAIPASDRAAAALTDY